MKRKRLMMILAIILAALLILPILIGALTASAASSSELDKLKKKASELAAQRKELAAEIREVESEKSSAMKQKIKIDEQIEVTEEEIANAEDIIVQLDADIAQKELELTQAEQAEDDEYALFKRRIRATEEAGSASYLSVLFNSEDFSDLLSRMDIISELLAYDQTIMDNLARARQLVADTKACLEEDHIYQESVLSDLEDRKTELTAQYAQAETLIGNLEDKADEYTAAYAEAEAASEKLQKEITAMIAELARQSVYVGGEYTWPLPGYYTITSAYGMRYHPILKVNKLHTGIDISAPKGTKIVAANAGTVIQAGYNSGYGNYVVVDHGGNQATLYGHMSKISVGVNQKVSKGDQLGLVGSTGWSTGNHLHFEIIINGKQVDPMKYFKKS